MTQEMEKCRNRGSAAMLLGPQKLLYIFVNDDGTSDGTWDMREPVDIKIGQAMRCWRRRRINAGSILQLNIIVCHFRQRSRVLQVGTSTRRTMPQALRTRRG